MMTAAGACCTAVDATKSGTDLGDIVATAGRTNKNMRLVIEKVCLMQRELSF